MEVRLRLQRAGRGVRQSRNYRIVAMAKHTPREGRALEILGYYDPSQKPAVFKLDQEGIDKWLDKGAQMSDTVKSLVKKTRKQAKS